MTFSSLLDQVFGRRFITGSKTIIQISCFLGTTVSHAENAPRYRVSSALLQVICMQARGDGKGCRGPAHLKQELGAEAHRRTTSIFASFWHCIGAGRSSPMPPL